jgi:aspartate-semialdehyde dehydrogenase
MRHNGKRYRVTIVGATGLVGEELLSILEERDFPVASLTLTASSKSAGRHVPAMGAQHTIVDLQGFSFVESDIVFFSAGTQVSKDHAPRAASAGALVIDNSNAFRMDPATPLVVPQVNADALKCRPISGIVANPNCSTIQLVRVLDPLDRTFGLQEVFCATYQAASGGGRTGIAELKENTKRLLAGEIPLASSRFPSQLAFNVIPQVDVFMENGLTLEEQKLRQETWKILGRESIRIRSFAARVPVINVHSEAVVMRFANAVNLEYARTVLASAAMIRVYAERDYPRLDSVSGSDDVHVSRLHLDPTDARVLYAWVSADNLRVGAALNAVQIAETACSQGVLDACFV